MFERFTEEARRVLFFARYAATEHGGLVIEPEHLLLGATRQPHALLPLHFTPGALNAIEEAAIAAVACPDKLPTSVEMPFSEAVKDVLKRSAIEADNLGSREICTAHVILAILTMTDGAARRALLEAGVSVDELRSLLTRTSRD